MVQQGNFEKQKFSKTIFQPCLNRQTLEGLLREAKVLTKEGLKNTKWHDTVFSTSYSNIEGFIQYADIKIPEDHVFGVIYGAQFMIARENILKKTTGFYKKCQDTLLSKAPVEGHYMERLWDVVFYS